MAELNEDVLVHIFDYLSPLEWAQASQVCKLWKLAASRKLEKIIQISYCKSSYEITHDTEAHITTRQDLEKIIRCVAPQVRVYKTQEEHCLDSDKISVTFQSRVESFVYNISDLVYESNDLLKLLTEHATEIKEICLNDGQLRTELLQLLFDNNNIKKVTIIDETQLRTFCEDFLTDSIEELTVSFRTQFFDYEGDFPNLKKLCLDIFFDYSSDPIGVLSSIVPSIPKVTSLSFSFSFTEEEKFERLADGDPLSYEDFLELTELQELEELTLESEDGEPLTDADTFINKLATDCKKLRALKFSDPNIEKTQLCSLLSMPHLESLEVTTKISFDSLELPMMMSMTRLHLKYYCRNLNISRFCNMLSQMPNLTSLTMNSLDQTRDLGEKLLELVCEIAILAASQGKNIVVREKLKIMKKNTNDTNIQILKFWISFESALETKLFENVVQFAQKKMQNYCAVVGDSV